MIDYYITSTDKNYILRFIWALSCKAQKNELDEGRVGVSLLFYTPVHGILMQPAMSYVETVT